MMTLWLYAILSAALFYLGSRALITRAIWSRYSPSFARFMDCAACTGFWYGVIWSLVLGDLHGPVFTQGVTAVQAVAFEAFLVGLAMLVLTPLVTGLMQHALYVVGSTVDTDSQGDE